MRHAFTVFLLTFSFWHFSFAKEPLTLKGIVLLSKDEPLLSAEKLKEIDSIEMISLDVPKKEALASRLKDIVQDQVLTAEKISEIRQAVSAHFFKCNRPFVITSAPDQDVSDGVLQLVVEESKVGVISSQGEKWSSSKRLMNYLSLEPGNTIHERDIFNALYFMNRNPFRRVDVIYSPGQKRGTTDISLAVQDRRPIRIYAGSDNTGVEPTNRARWYTGVNWGNAFGQDHVLSYQYTASYDLDRFQAHTGQYLALLPWKHTLNIYGGYNKVKPKISNPIIKNTGWGMQGSLRYEIPLFVGQFLEQQVNFGCDFKRTNNTFTFTDESSNFGRIVNLSQAVLGYAGDYERNSFRLDFKGNLFWSPGELLADQTNADFATLRPGAKNKWVYFRGTFVYLQKIADYSLTFLAEGQATNTALLPSEQFGLGGYDSVRGYDERVISMDNAILLSIEGRTPPLSIAGKRVYRYGALQFLAFFDYGWGIDDAISPPIAKSEFLMGTGPGIRYTLEPYITARLDWGIKLHKNSVIGETFSKVHFNATVSY